MTSPIGGRARLWAPAAVTAGVLVAAGASAHRSLELCRANLRALNLPRTALTATTPIVTPPTPAAARRVVVVVVDGLAHWASLGLPELTALRAQGVDAVARSHLPSISRPNYVSLLAGVPPAHSGVRSNAFSWPVHLDSLPSRVAAAGGTSAYVTDSAPSVATLFAGAFSEVSYAPWSGGFRAAAERALAADHRLVVLLPGAVDECGHTRRMAGAACRRVARELDRELGALARRLDWTRDALIVTADHGHVRTGGHGGDERAVLEVPLVLVGAGVAPGATLAGVELVDVPATAAALLGVSAPGHGLGRPLLEALALPKATADQLRGHTAVRVAVNHAVVQAEVELGRRAQVAARRAHVGPLALAILALAVGLAGLHRAKAVALSWRSAVGGLASAPVAAVAMFFASDCMGSLSCFSNQDEWRSRGWVAAGAAALALGWAARAARRGCARSELLSANAVSAVVLGAIAVWQLALDGLVAPGRLVALPGDPVLFLLVATPALSLALSVALVGWRLFALAVWAGRYWAKAPANSPAAALVGDEVARRAPVSAPVAAGSLAPAPRASAPPGRRPRSSRPRWARRTWRWPRVVGRTAA